MKSWKWTKEQIRYLFPDVKFLNNTTISFENNKYTINEFNLKFFKHGLIFRVSNEILNIGPPLIITRSEIDEIVHAIDLSLWELEGELGLPVND